MSKTANSTHLGPVPQTSENAEAFRNSLNELLREPCNVKIETRNFAQLKSSHFWGNDQQGIYCLNPSEHPFLTWLLDSLLNTVEQRTNVEISRSSPEQGYVLQLTRSCSECNSLDCDHAETATAHGLPYMIESILSDTTLPANRNNIPVNRSYVTTEAGKNITEIDSEQIAKFDFSQLTPTQIQTISTSNEPINASLVSITLDGLSSTMGAFLTILDEFRTARETFQQFPDQPVPQQNIDVNTDEDVVKEFTKERNDFFVETPAGWRFRWILKGAGSDAFPVERIAASVNLQQEEAELMSVVAQAVGMAESNMDGNTCTLKLSDEWETWKETRRNNDRNAGEYAFVAGKDASNILHRLSRALAYPDRAVAGPTVSIKAD